MNISQKGLDIIKHFEGCYLKAYYCPAGVLTIGYGHTKNVSVGQVITQDQADNLLREDMAVYEGYVNKCSALTFTPNQNQFDALVSFTFNCGAGSLKTLVEGRSPEVVAEKLLLYINANGKPLEGLRRRRVAERELFLSNCENVGGNEDMQVKELPLLRFGARGNLVKGIQAILGVSADGVWGNNTEKAIRNFQSRNGLSVDGIVGENTYKALFNI